jgi:hypothetical protein
VRLEQYLSTTKPLHGSFGILEDVQRDATFFIPQPNEIFLVYGNFLVPGSIPANQKIASPVS